MKAAERFRHFVEEVAQAPEVVSARSVGQGTVFFEVATGQGRSQVVMAQLVRDEEGQELLHMLSEIGPVEPALCEELLMRNLGFFYARVAVLESEQGRVFAVVYARPVEGLDAVEFARAFGEVAWMADGIERDIYNRDRA